MTRVIIHRSAQHVRKKLPALLHAAFKQRREAIYVLPGPPCRSASSLDARVRQHGVALQQRHRHHRDKQR